MTDFSVLAIDPGVTTGFCLGYKHTKSKLLVAPYEMRLDVEGLTEHLEEIKPDNIVCESFEYRPGQSKPFINLFPREAIGVVQLYGKQHDTPVFMQSASTGKAYFKNDKLKELGLYKRGSEHARDATRHLLYWLNFGSGFQHEIDLADNELMMLFQLQKVLQ